MLKKATLQTAESFEKKLTYISRIYAFVGPIGILVSCATAEYLFTDYFLEERKIYMLPILVAVIILIAGRLVFRNISKGRLAFEYALLTIMATVAYNLLLEFPSPYILAGFVFAVLIYFDFGWRWTALSLVVQYGTVLTTAFVLQLQLKEMIDILAYILTPVAVTVFVIRLQSLARQEIRSIQKNYQKAIANAQRTLSLVNNISDGVIAVDQNFRVFTYNAAALDVLDLNIDIKGKKITSILKPINAEKQKVDLQVILEKTITPTINRNLLLNYKDGSFASLFLGVSPIHKGQGKNTQAGGYTLLIRDITREKSLEEERDEFISVVSHELRTPIAISEGGISNAELILDRTQDIAAVKKALTEAHKQIVFLADMTNDLSTLSRAERGVLEVETSEINIYELCEELYHSYLQSALNKKLELKIEPKPNIQPLLSSKLYVREILQNFITNAIKYTEKGSVTIVAESNKDGVVFIIKDTGIGMAKSDQDKVFEKFFRAEDYRTRRNNGTGLGLYVTMKLVHLIHAEVTVESELDKGSSFRVKIPDYKK